jgi:dienelactone hydrolase
MFRKLAAALIIGVAALPAAAAPAPEQVQFDSADGTLVPALLFLPNGATKGTVIALHGCAGMYAQRGARKGSLSEHYQRVADLLTAQGYGVLFPDSLGARGVTEICTERMESRRIGQYARRADALGALTWLAGQPWAAADRIALVGWSHGGSAVLAATDLARPVVRGTAVRPALAIAFYPGCAAALFTGYQPSAPLVLMLAEKDDWTAPGPCVQLGKAAGAEIHVFDDSYHGFDSPVGKVRLRPEVPNGVNPGQGVHVGPNPAAREQAYARMLARLAQAFR